MSELEYQDTTLNGYRYSLTEKLDIYTVLKDFVDYNLITEWQAGYVTSLYEKFSIAESYQKLLLFIHSQIDKED